jgi:hypothetical protein
MREGLAATTKERDGGAAGTGRGTPSKRGPTGWGHGTSAADPC